MEKTSVVRQKIVHLILENCGERMGNAFGSSYEIETFPIFLDAAVSVLSELLGKEKTRERVNHILINNNMNESV